MVIQLQRQLKSSFYCSVQLFADTTFNKELLFYFLSLFLINASRYLGNA